MLEILKAILYGIVEGITEWLPISSTSDSPEGDYAAVRLRGILEHVRGGHSVGRHCRRSGAVFS